MTPLTASERYAARFRAWQLERIALSAVLARNALLRWLDVR